MLVLSRKTDQSVELPELGVVIRVMALKRSRVQLGIEAPREIQVIRGEKVVSGDTDWSDRTAGAVLGVNSEATAVAWIDELKRMEVQLAALAELANAHDRRVAREVAGDAIDRVAMIRRGLIRMTQVSATVAPDSDAATDAEAEQPDALSCVRQEQEAYRVEFAEAAA